MEGPILDLDPFSVKWCQHTLNSATYDVVLKESPNKVLMRGSFIYYIDEDDLTPRVQEGVSYRASFVAAKDAALFSDLMNLILYLKRIFFQSFKYEEESVVRSRKKIRASNRT